MVRNQWHDLDQGTEIFADESFRVADPEISLEGVSDARVVHTAHPEFESLLSFVAKLRHGIDPEVFGRSQQLDVKYVSRRVNIRIKS
jgi:hypothetical protein